MAGEEGLDASALASDELASAAARHLGAARVVWSKLEGSSLKITVIDLASKKAQTETVALPAGAAAAVDTGGIALARAVTKQEGKNLQLKEGFVSPQTTSDEAM